MHLLFRYVFLLFCLLAWHPSAAIATKPDATLKEAQRQALAQFFGVDANKVQVECPEQTLSLTQEGSSQVLHICTHQELFQKRCEVALQVLERYPAHNRIRYEVRLGGDWMLRDRWFLINQIHSFPDYDEKWRCPMLSLEVDKNGFRMPNRWDSTPISRTSGYNCTEPGSTIQERMLFQDLPALPDRWHTIQIDAQLSGRETGQIQVQMDKIPVTDNMGVNAYNDKRPPFLKFGIYIPNGWGKHEKTLCADYRHVKVETSE